LGESGEVAGIFAEATAGFDETGGRSADSRGGLGKALFCSGGSNTEAGKPVVGEINESVV